MNHTSNNTCLFRSVAAAALIGTCGIAFAAGGNIAGVSATPASVFVNDIVTLKMSIADGSYGVDCNAAWSVRDINNVEVKSGSHRMQSDSNNYDYTVQFGISTPGVYAIQAHSGTPSSQAVVCLGNATATLNVKAKSRVVGIATPINPIFKTNPIPVNPGNPGVIRKQ
jgi:hypothetical protein